MARSHLYVPGDQPDKLARAAERGADALIVDLEEAVAPNAKAAARHAVTAWLDALIPRPDVEIWVRVNPAGPLGEPPEEDLVVVHPAVTGIVQAKCQSRDALVRLDESIGRREERNGTAVGATKVAVLVESAAGVIALPSLAGAPRVARLQAGEADLAASLGMQPGPGSPEFTPLRWSLVVTSAAAGLDPPIGPVQTDVFDLEELRRTTVSLRRMGFGGRAALHPTQVQVINEVFMPTLEEVQSATALLTRFQEAVDGGKGVFVQPDGLMVDQAVAASARQLLDRYYRT